MKYYGGIDGGATSTSITIMNEEGKVVATMNAEGSNLYNIGVAKAVELFHRMIEKVKKMAGIKALTPLHSLGLCLSGAETESIKHDLLEEFKLRFPNDYNTVRIANDLVSSAVACVGQKGDIFVIISGTGSNSGLVTNCELKTTCGGTGYILGETGSAIWIARCALKIILRHYDNYTNTYSSYSIEKLKKSAMEEFNFKTKTELIDAVYSNFSTDKVARFAKNVSVLANENDELSIQIFKKVGIHLAKFLISNLTVNKDSVGEKIHVLCIGSVWKSWNLLKETFLSELSSHLLTRELIMMKLKVSPSVGSVIFALPNTVPYNLSENYEKFFQKKFVA